MASIANEKGPTSTAAEGSVGTNHPTNDKVEVEDVEHDASKDSLLTVLRQNPRLSAWGIVLASNCLMFGYEIAFVGSIAALPAFKCATGLVERSTR